MSQMPVEGFQIPLGSLEGAARERLPATVRGLVAGPPDAPLLVALGGISGNREPAVREDGRPGWWAGLFGPGAPLSPDRWRILGIDFAADDEGRFVPTTHDQAAIIHDALAALGEQEAHAIVGASYGGMVALAYAERFRPMRTRLAILGAAHRPHPMGTAIRALQRRILALGLESGRAEDGLVLARALAMTSYRSAREFGERFAGGIRGDDPLGPSEPFAYLEARGRAWIEQMPPGRFLSLSASIDRHRVDPAAITPPTLVFACPDDQVVPFADAEALTAALAGPARLETIDSRFGHDFFLKEGAAIAPALAAFLEQP